MDRESAIAALEELPSVKVVSLQPGDVIVVEVPRMISPETAERIETSLNKLWPDHKSVILADGLTLSIKREPNVD